MSTLDKIRNLIGTFYDDPKLDAEKFREQFGILFTETDESDIETETIAIQVEGLFADYIEGILTEQSLRERLFVLVPSIRIHVEVLADVPADNPAYRYFQFGPSGNAVPTIPTTQTQVAGSDSPVANPRLVPCAI